MLKAGQLVVCVWDRETFDKANLYKLAYLTVGRKYTLERVSEDADRNGNYACHFIGDDGRRHSVYARRFMPIVDGSLASILNELDTI